VSAGVGGGGGGGKDQDFELNLASIIDCFTVLITYLLVSASFISIGVFDVGISGPGAASADVKPPPVTIGVSMDGELNLTFRVTGDENKTVVLPPKDGKWDLDGAVEQMKALHQRWPDVNTTLLSAEPAIEYKDLVRAIEALKKVIPFVYIGEA
jgi:biopolymer transport protein ExbD